MIGTFGVTKGKQNKRVSPSYSGRDGVVTSSSCRLLTFCEYLFLNCLTAVCRTVVLLVRWCTGNRPPPLDAKEKVFCPKKFEEAKGDKRLCITPRSLRLFQGKPFPLFRGSLSLSLSCAHSRSLLLNLPLFSLFSPNSRYQWIQGSDV